MVSSRENLWKEPSRRSTLLVAWQKRRSRFSPFMEKEQERRTRSWHGEGAFEVGLCLTTEIYRFPFAFSSCPSFVRSRLPFQPIQLSCAAFAVFAHKTARTVLSGSSTLGVQRPLLSAREGRSWNTARGTARWVIFRRLSISRLPRKKKQTYVISII